MLKKSFVAAFVLFSFSLVAEALPPSVPANVPWVSGSPAWVGGPNVISEYDQIIRRASAQRGLDWRFVSAIANAESRFDDDVVSYAGAVGLMQIMPAVARGFNVAREDMIDPAVNVSMGVRHLDAIGKMFKFPAGISERDRLSIILASYNCGPGRVLDARRLAAKYGENHNSWSVVAKYLKLLREPEYFSDSVVRTGSFRGSGQTLGYVAKVMNYYDDYREIATL